MKQKSVLFIEPSGAPSNVFAKFMTIPLLGPLYLGALARKAGYDVRVVNENIVERPVNDHELARADVLCLSCITATVQRGKHIARRYRAVREKAGLPSRSIIGGIHASMLPDDVAGDFDQVVTGEAESVILDVLSGKITDRRVQGSRLEDLDSLPPPDFSLLAQSERVNPTPVMTSRGCPYTCTFCSVTEMFGRGYRSQSAGRVMREVEKIDSGYIFFVDDHFAANPKRTNDLLDSMIAGGSTRTWTAQVRTEVTKKPALVRKMRDAGCRTVFVGFESINPDALADMDKRQSVEDIKRSIRVFHDSGITVHGMFMLGSDADTPDVFPMTSDFCYESGLDFAQYCILTPLPGTVVYRDLERQDRLLHKDWRHYDGLHAVFRPARMTPAQLQQGMIRCFSDFYNYTNAFNDALNAAADAVGFLVRSLYKRAYFPSFYPSFMRAAGRTIVQNWVRGNRDYLEYLQSVS